MDLSAVASYRTAADRRALALAAGEMLLGGGTWLFSTPQPAVTGLVDLTTMGWPPVEARTDGSIRIAGTCTVAQLVEALGDDAVLGPVVRAAADALLMSFKVQRAATVGGNLALALPAGAMISLTAALGGTVVVWSPDGTERTEPVTRFVRGVGDTSLAPGEVIRAVDVRRPERAAFQRVSLATYGRSGAVVTGRATTSGPVLIITGATTRPVVVRDLVELDAVDCWYADAHGAADWRAAMSALLARRVVAELAA